MYISNYVSHSHIIDSIHIFLGSYRSLANDRGTKQPRPWTGFGVSMRRNRVVDLLVNGKFMSYPPIIAKREGLYMSVSKNGGSPIAGWFILWNI